MLVYLWGSCLRVDVFLMGTLSRVRIETTDHMQRITFAFSIALVMLTALFFASVALADPTEDPVENWCYEGGAWGDGRCTLPGNPALTEWYWTCGYYRAQVVKGAYSMSHIPQTCQDFVAQDIVGSTASSGGNVGSANNGDFNTGAGNSGSSNTGSTNNGDFNTGVGNSGSSNTGSTNDGSFNIGAG